MAADGFIDRLTPLLPIGSAGGRERLLPLLEWHARNRLKQLGRESYGPLLDRPGASGSVHSTTSMTGRRRSSTVLVDATARLAVAFRGEPWPTTVEAILTTAANLIRRGLVNMAAACRRGLALHEENARTLEKWQTFHEAGGQLPDPAWTAWMLGHYLGVTAPEFELLVEAVGGDANSWVVPSAARFAAVRPEALVRLREALKCARTDHAGDASDGQLIDQPDDVLREQVKLALSRRLPPRSGHNPPAVFDSPRRWVDQVFEEHFSHRSLTDSERMRFYILAAEGVAVLLREWLGPTDDTVRNLLTPGAASPFDLQSSGPALRRRRRLEQRDRRFRELKADPDVGTVYPLVRYAGRQVSEIARLMGRDPQETEDLIVAVLNAVEGGD